MHRLHAPVHTLHHTSHDGTRLRAFHIGRGPLRWLLTPGLGTPLLCWKPLLDGLSQHVTFLAWDMRGCHGSDKPLDSRRLTVEDHARDGLGLARSQGWADGEYVVGGWSLGVQIALEIRRQLAQPLQGLVLINGAFEHVLRSALPLPGGEALLQTVLRGAPAARRWLNPTVRGALALPQTLTVLHALGMVAETGPFLREVLTEFRELDFATLAELTRHAHLHSARGVLPHVTEPTLIVAGQRDTMTPQRLGRELHALVQGSELLVVPGGTHYTPVEYPELLLHRIATFLRDRVGLAQAA